MNFNALLKQGLPLFFFLFMAAACLPADQKPQPKLETAELFIDTKNGKSIKVKAELARTDAEKSKGLMFRTTLLDGEAMLFIWQKDSVLSFWMKNTLIPLSIAYINKDGIIMEIHDMQSGQLNAVQSQRSLRYALEVPQGWFEREGITSGDRISGAFLPRSSMNP